MGTPFLGEIKIMSFGFAPRNWAMCNGQFLPINQNQALFSLLGTIYGGNGQTTFALPDLRGQTPIHQGKTRSEQKAASKRIRCRSRRCHCNITHLMKRVILMLLVRRITNRWQMMQSARTGGEQSLRQPRRT